MKPKIRESTWRDYRNGLHRVSDRLGQVPLQSLRPLDVEELYADLLREGRRYGGGLAPKTVRNIHIALRRSLADALRFGLVSRNVAALVKPPVPGRSELATWTADEVRAFLDAVGTIASCPPTGCSPPPACVEVRRWGCAGPTSISRSRDSP